MPLDAVRNQSRLVVIQRNPTSGSGVGRREVRELVRHLRRLGLTPRLFSRRESIARFFDRRQCQSTVRCIVAAGGDGTVGSVVNRFPDVPVAILPLGTENLLARYLGIRRCGMTVANMIADGHCRRLDLGVVNECRFTVMASIGFDADVVHRMSSQRRGTIRKVKYLQPIFAALRKYRYPELRIFLDESMQPRSARLMIAVNLPAYALNLKIAANARGDDGLLDLRLFRRGSTFQMIRYCCKVAFNLHEQLDDVECVQASEFRVESDEPVPVQVDGDPVGTTPVTIRVLPDALTVLVPDSERKSVAR